MSEDQFDLTICPDCNRKQMKERVYQDDCENNDCESYVTKYPESGKLIWWNPNWDLPDDYKEEE